MNVPGYDHWRLASPPEDDAPCKHCGETFENHDEFNDNEPHDFEADPYADGGDEKYDQAKDDALTNN